MQTGAAVLPTPTGPFYTRSSSGINNAQHSPLPDNLLTTCGVRHLLARVCTTGRPCTRSVSSLTCDSDLAKHTPFCDALPMRVCCQPQYVLRQTTRPSSSTPAEHHRTSPSTSSTDYIVWKVPHGMRDWNGRHRLAGFLTKFWRMVLTLDLFNVPDTVRRRA